MNVETLPTGKQLLYQDTGALRALIFPEMSDLGTVPLP